MQGLAAATPEPAQAYAVKTTAAGHKVRWGKKRVVMKLGARFVDLLGEREAGAAASMAAEAWRGMPGVPDVVFAEKTAPGYDPDRRTNGVYLLSPWPFEPHQVAVTVSTYRPSGEIQGADVLFNGEREFGLLDEVGEPDRSRHDVAAVLTHELGHVLGLDESEDPTSAMWPNIAAGETHQRVLAEDDEEGVMIAYSGPSPAHVASCSAAGTGHGGISAWPLTMLLATMLPWRWTRRRPGRRSA